MKELEPDSPWWLLAYAGATAGIFLAFGWAMATWPTVYDLTGRDFLLSFGLRLWLPSAIGLAGSLLAGAIWGTRPEGEDE